MRLFANSSATGRRRWLTLALGAVAFAPFLLVFTHTGERDSPGLILSEADQDALRDGLRMLSPSFAGRTENGEPFVITADWALPNGPNPTRVILSGVEAHVTLEDGREARMTAKNGAFFPREERLRLENGVAARTSDGYRLDTSAVTVDAGAKTLLTDSAVEATGPMGSIRADSLEALDGFDRVVIFKGRVRAVIRPDGAATPRNEPAQD